MTDETSEQLDGDSFEIELPFEQILYENLRNTSTGLQTNIITGTVTDENLEPASPKAHIFYTNKSIFSGQNIAFIDNLDVRNEINLINIPLHGNSTTNPQYSTTFSAAQNVWNGDYLDKNLYSNHYENYISDIFNIKKRTWKYKGYLPINIITKLGLNDTLIIKDSYYRIDKYSYNIMTGETQLELINNFDTTIVGGLKTSTNNLQTDYRAKVEDYYVANLTGSTFNKVDLGSGTGWANVVTVETAETQENILQITFTENIAETVRNLTLEITSAKGEVLNLSILQTAKFITSDNNNITSDNNNITSDNNG